jgi:radical SAM superfamily enzyme YgiQ (UPF0313 family)
MKRRRILLVHPGLESNLLGLLALYKEEPLGLEYISSSLKKDGHFVKIIDANILRLSPERTVKIIKKFKPEIVGITLYSGSYLWVKRFVFLLKRSYPTLKIVVGGPHISHLLLDTTNEIKEIDIGVAGAGEEVMRKIVNGNMSSLQGVSYREREKVIIKPGYNIIENLDSLPFPDRTSPFRRKYYSFGLKKPTFTIITSRGCPFNCLFCAKMWNMMRFREIKNVIKEWDSLVKKGARSIFVADDTFTLNKKRVIKICKELIKKGLTKVEWGCQSRVDTIDEETMYWLKKAGCRNIFLGVESFSQRSLNEINKRITVSQIEESLKLLKKHGFTVFASFVIGLSNEKLKDFIITREYLKTYRKYIDIATFHFLQPFPGSPLFSILYKGGKLRWWEVKFGVNEQPHMAKYIKKHILKTIRRVLILRFYLSVYTLPTTFKFLLRGEFNLW